MIMYEEEADRELNEAEDGAESEVSEAEDTELLKQALSQAREKAESNLAGWQRAQADFINYRNRSEWEKADLVKYAKGELIMKLLPALDDMERALAAIPPRQKNLGWVEGVRLIERKLRATLEAEGLEPIKALGEPFDPHLHEAVMAGKGKEGAVVGEIEKGYQLNDRVLRPSKVVVGSGEEDEEGET
jgi:molecular chaperone GrpE